MLLMFSVFGFVVALDQATKAMVAARLQEGTPTLGTIWGVRFRHVVNRRRPWGSAGGVRLMTVAWLLFIAAAFMIANVIEMNTVRIALGAAMGGATGNLIDGVYRGAVTDFIDLRVWPVFNVADAAIVGGAMLMIWEGIRFL